MDVAIYPPTFEDLRKSFLALHPDYEFGILVYKTEGGMEFRYQVPKEPVGGTSMCDDPCSDICHARGWRFQEWINYIYNQTKLIAAEANVTIALPKESELLPQRWTGDIFQPQPIQRLIRVEDAYVQLCHNPEITPAKRLAREQAREAKRLAQEEAHKAKIRMERKRKEELIKAKKRREIEIAAEKKRHEEEVTAAIEWAIKTVWKFRIDVYTKKEEIERLIRAYRVAMIHSKKISSLATKASLTEQEAEAILAHLDPSSKFKKDTLLSLKIFNKFATDHAIRVEDAITVFREYAL